MTGEATNVCDHCGCGLVDTEIRFGRCGRCLTNPDLPLPLGMVAPAPETGDIPALNPGDKHYRYRPLRFCGCGVYLKPRMRYCDKCRTQQRRAAGRTRIQRLRQRRMAARPT
jgi:hypothetical protein